MRRIVSSDMDHCVFDDYFLEHEELTALADQFGTPLFVYDEKGLRSRAKSLLSVFSSCVKDHYFPVEFCPVPGMLRVLSEEGMGAHCQTPEELRLALDCGFPGDRILYGSSLLFPETAKLIKELDCVLLAGCPLALQGELPSRVLLLCGRFDKGAKRNGLYKPPVEIGFSGGELKENILALQQRGVASVGLALRYGGNITDAKFLPNMISSIAKAARELTADGVRVDMLHMTGGFGIEYHRVNFKTADPAAVCEKLADVMAYSSCSLSLSLGRLFAEPCGIFAMRVMGVADRIGPLIVTDACNEDIKLDLVDKYHHISLSGRNEIPGRSCCDIASHKASFREWFGRHRAIHKPKPGDLLVLHDAGCCRPLGFSHAALVKREDGGITVLQHGKKQQCANTNAQGGNNGG